ncbi:hypothetical protein ACFS3C_16915 [Azotobacter vinelandii]|uniref:hypothetical protein n=1 Tax=Azotobacter TaxID=352 RepID=UPI000301B820|nr:hypothetical protein [Azotobacter vinelandii]GLK59420.1 hypothetical protein GCM10017624_15770 [Azotobacter vinelandii]SFX88617.1 hypothetical protein SAMN04244547_03107 [Azotobacter vinelandii]
MLNLSSRSQLIVGALLALLMAVTRGHHFATLDLPSASWAVFFLAGVLLRPRWAFPALFLEASLLDFVAIGWMGASDWCLSPAYWLLVPAYGSLWLGGRLYARLQRDSLVALGLAVVFGAFVCYLFSGGGFYFFSGRYAEPTFAGFVQRLIAYYPRNLAGLALYVGLAALLYAGFATRLKTLRVQDARG